MLIVAQFLNDLKLCLAFEFLFPSSGASANTVYGDLILGECF